MGVSQRFAPSTRLAELIPENGRREFWSRLSKTTGLQLPNLIRPAWLENLNASITGLGAMFLALASMYFLSGVLTIFVAIVSWVLLGYLTRAVTVVAATRFAPSFETFRGLSQHVLAQNTATLRQRTTTDAPMSRSDIFVVMRQILVDVLAIDPEEVTREAHLINDLGLD